MAKAKKNEVATQEPAGLPADLEAEMAGDAGDGAQNITSDDMAIPFIRILQQMSPQLAKRDGQYVEGAEEGQIFNTVTGELWDAEEGISVIPVSYNFKRIQWKSRDAGGGFVAAFERGDPNTPITEKNDKGKDIVVGGDDILSDTAEHYVLLVSDSGQCEQCLITMSSTQLKNSRKWNSLMNQQQIQTDQGMKVAPTYSRSYRLKTVGESNDHGSWSGWQINLEGVLSDVNLYRAAKVFSKAIGAGEVEVKHVQEGAES